MSEATRPAGYAHLIQRYGLSVRSNWHTSAVSATHARRTVHTDAEVSDVYPAKHWPGDSAGDHLEFAVKYDGTNLHILAAVFAVLPPGELLTYVRSKPNGKYARRLWFLYEWLTGESLPLSPLAQGNYVPLIDPEEQYTAVGRRAHRQRVLVNLLGDNRFCPTVRRTERLAAAEAARLDERGRRVLAACPPDVLRRAMHYLYTKETRSSFEIEREEPTADRVERFVSLLHTAEQDDYVDKDRLVELQNQVVDPRFRESDYRSSQNCVGQTVRPGYEKVHFIPPRPADVGSLMDGWAACHRRLEAAVHPVVHAAVTAFGFVFIHPFEDGTGRVHRFLIHNVLARRSFTPRDVIFPVSAVMLKDGAAYDRSLEAFSAPLRPLVDYVLDDRGRMTVRNETAPRYRFMDLTAQAEALFEFVRGTIDHELVDEIRFIQMYDQAKRSIQAIVDAPDRLIDLFIRCCAQNHGKLGQGKRRTHFHQFADDEITAMEAAIERAQAPTGDYDPSPGAT
jgi:hypothetical protein